MSENIILVTVSDDRFGRKDGNYGKTQDKIEHIFKINTHFGINKFLTVKWVDIESSPFYKTNESLLKHTDAGKNGRAYKPYAILQGLKSINEGDYLIYTDCSPEMWSMGRGFMVKPEYFDVEVLKNLCKNNNDILTCFVKWKNSNLAKGDNGIHTHRWFTTNRCIDTMGLRFYEDGYQHASGMWVIRKTAETIEFVDEWLKWNLIDECCALGSVGGTADEYWNDPIESTKVGHRHDQSISGLLLNKTNQKFVDILYNEMNPYNFLQFARKNTEYKFIESLPPLNIGDKVINRQGTEMEVWKMEGDKYVVGKLQESCYASERQNLKKI